MAKNYKANAKKLVSKLGNQDLSAEERQRISERVNFLNSRYKTGVKAPGQVPQTGGPLTTNNTSRTLDETTEVFRRSMDEGSGFADRYLPAGTFGTLQGGTSAQTQAYLDNLGRLANSADQMTPEMQQYLASVNADLDATRRISPEMLANLERLRGQADSAFNYTGLEQEAIDRTRAGLAGFNTPELQAMREQAAQQLNQDLQTQSRLAMLNNARNRVRGGAASAGLMDLQSGAQRARGNLERDLVVKQADETRLRQDAFNNLIRTTEDARFGRRNTAETLYSNTLGSDEMRRAQERNSLQGTYGSVLSADQVARNNRLAELQRLYGGALSGEEGIQRAINQFNIGQAQNEALARSGLALQGAGTYSGIYGGQSQTNLNMDYLEQMRAQQQQQNDIMQKQIDAYRNTFRG